MSSKKQSSSSAANVAATAAASAAVAISAPIGKASLQTINATITMLMI